MSSKKFNGEEYWVIENAIINFREALKKEIDDINSDKQKTHIFTKEFVDQICDRAMKKVDKHTLKSILKTKENEKQEKRNRQ